MRILGVSCYYHDAATALLEDGMLVAAAQEERFSRRKHDPRFPARAVDFCLRQAGCTAADLDFVVFYEKPFLKFERLILSILQTYPRSSRVFREAMFAWLGDKLWIKSRLQEHLGVGPEKILFVEHHLSHAASALFCSSFPEAAILTTDGVGEWTTTALGRGTADWNGGGQNEIVLQEELRFPHSLGLLYSAFTAFLGFQVNEGEYKVMGMAPYGEPGYVEKVQRLLDVRQDGSFHLDMSYFSYHYHHERAINGKFESLFGPPRDPKSRFVTKKTSLYDDPNPPPIEELARNQYYADVAASIQWVTEDALLKMAHHLYEMTGLKKLCIAGGVGLNSVANFRMLRETPFEELYIHPAAGDAGGAIGAALYAYHVLLGRPRKFIMEHAHWGEEYGGQAIQAALSDRGVRAEWLEDEALMDQVVQALIRGKVIGWYQGRFEWGPRALGNRSILADPRSERMKDIVNIKIKFREPFRPFAPSVLAEETEGFFDLPGAAHHYPARFMLYVVPVKRGVRIPAITHVDGSGRLQTVHKALSPRYHRLIEKFDEATGIPLVLNTSFNLKGEPIVATPQDALNTFSKSGMDILVLGNAIVRKDR